MVVCPKCESHAVEAYLYKEKEEVYYGHHCLNCGFKSSDVKENDPLEETRSASSEVMYLNIVKGEYCARTTERCIGEDCRDYGKRGCKIYFRSKENLEVEEIANE